MNGRRAAAVLVAIVLVAGALFVRRAIDEDESTTTTVTSPDGSAPPTTATAPAETVICVEELAALCDALTAEQPDLDVRVEPAFDTLSALTALAPGEDVPIWLTLQPFPGMVDAGRAAAGDDPLGVTITPVASTPLAVAAPAGGRLEALAAHCAATPLWACIGDRAGASWTEAGGEAAWGIVRPSLGRVESSPVALVAFSAAVAGYFGTVDISRSAWETDPGFTAWVRRLARTVPVTSLSGSTPLSTMATRPALDLAATTDAELASLGATADRFDQQYPEPSMFLDAAVAAPDGVDVADIQALTTGALVGAGWLEATEQPAPSASATLALLQLWKDAT